MFLDSIKCDNKNIFLVNCVGKESDIVEKYIIC